MTPNQFISQVERRIRSTGSDPEAVILNVTTSDQTVIMQFSSKAWATLAVDVAGQHGGITAVSLGFQTVQFTIPPQKKRGKKTISLESGEVDAMPTGEVG